jgi:nucleoside recognition membrane protein YjiH
MQLFSGAVLVYLGAGLLIYLAIEMFFEGVVTPPYLEPFMRIERIVGIGAAALFVWLAGRKAGVSPRTERVPETVPCLLDD